MSTNNTNNDPTTFVTIAKHSMPKITQTLYFRHGNQYIGDFRKKKIMYFNLSLLENYIASTIWTIALTPLSFYTNKCIDNIRTKPRNKAVHAITNTLLAHFNT